MYVNPSRLGRLMLMLALTLALIGAIGCCTKMNPVANLEQATSITLYSIDGNHYPQDEIARRPANAEIFHGYPVLGKIELTDAADRKTLLSELRRGIEANEGTVAGCFIPRHALRATEASGTVDYVICFQCMQINVYENGKSGTNMLTTAAPQPAFDAILKKAKIALAP